MKAFDINSTLSIIYTSNYIYLRQTSHWEVGLLSDFVGDHRRSHMMGSHDSNGHMIVLVI